MTSSQIVPSVGMPATIVYQYTTGYKSYAQPGFLSYVSPENDCVVFSSGTEATNDGTAIVCTRRYGAYRVVDGPGYLVLTIAVTNECF